MFKTLKQDYQANTLNLKRLLLGIFYLHPFWLVFTFRIANGLYRRHIPLLPDILMAIAKVFYSAEISPRCSIGPCLRIAHSVGIVIGDQAVIGRNFQVFQNVTIGGTKKGIYGRIMPIIGDNVRAMAGANIIGPVVIGDNVTIGAGSLVAKDIPAGLVVVGNPSRVINTADKL